MSATPADPTLRDIVSPVVADLVARVPQAAGRLMLVGALCRDVLHREAGHTFDLRRTGDLDLALAVDGWERYAQIVDDLPSVRGGAQVRYSVAGTKVDLVPFGGVEHPDGSVPLHHAGADPLDVLGFGDVWNDAREVALGEKLTIRLPTVPGYTVLKLASWAARSRAGEYKDAGDLACTSYWYLQSSTVQDRLYGDERGQLILGEAWSRGMSSPRRSCSPTTRWQSLRPGGVPSSSSGGTGSTTTCSRRTRTIPCCRDGPAVETRASLSTPGPCERGWRCMHHRAGERPHPAPRSDEGRGCASVGHRRYAPRTHRTAARRPGRRPGPTELEDGMPSRVTAPAMFRWGIGLLAAGVLAGVLPYQLVDSGTLLGTLVFQWIWQVLAVLQYLGGALIAVSLGVRALEGRLAPPVGDQAFAEPGPYGPGGGHPNPQP